MHLSFLRSLALAVALMSPGGLALAQTAAPPAPAAPASVPQDLPPSRLAAARELVISSGLSRSFDVLIPNLMDQTQQVLTRTRPELLADVKDVMNQLKPEFMKKTDEMMGNATVIMAAAMSEDELKTANAFFNSPAGLRYVNTQPQVFDRLMNTTQLWAQKVGGEMIISIRAEMKKRGKDL